MTRQTTHIMSIKLIRRSQIGRWLNFPSESVPLKLYVFLRYAYIMCGLCVSPGTHPAIGELGSQKKWRQKSPELPTFYATIKLARAL